jgi:c-di-GMP-binding flagellar brake protein YcgR
MTGALGANDRRANPRIAVALDLHLERKVGNAVIARTLDLSVGGATFVSDRPLRVDEELRFDLRLRGGDEHLRGTARVLRQHRHDTYAVRFEQVAPAALRDLDAFVGSGTDAALG